MQAPPPSKASSELSPPEARDQALAVQPGFTGILGLPEAHAGIPGGFPEGLDTEPPGKWKKSMERCYSSCKMQLTCHLLVGPSRATTTRRKVSDPVLELLVFHPQVCEPFS